MKITASQWPSVAHTSGKGFHALLFYGDSDAYMTERVQSMLGSLVSHTLLEADLLNGTRHLIDLLLIPDFFQTNSIYVIAQASDKLVPLLQETIEHLKTRPGGRLFLVRAAEYLGPSSKLRKMFEEDPTLGSVPCYDPSGREVDGVIQRFIARHHKRLVPDAFKRLRQIGEHQFAGFPGLLESLISYVGERPDISLADVEACRIDDGSDDVREVCEEFFDRNAGMLAHRIQDHLDQDMSPVTMIRQLSNYTLRLFEIKQNIKKGASLEQALMAYKPPISFKERPRLAKQMGHWSEEQLKRLLEDLVCLEGEIKGSSTLAKDILAYRLLAYLVSA